MGDGSSYSFNGWYEADGHVFLVFENAGFIFIFSGTATAASSGYPADLTLLPTLTTTPLAVCFCAGTMIDAPRGAKAVEDLRIGDSILTADGTAIAVKWIGRQRVIPQFAPTARLMPVRIAAGALGNGLPVADLTVSADHGMVLDGMVINAGALVNGESVAYVPASEMPEVFTYYHIETEGHRIIRANGAATETFVDYVGRQAFDNYAEYQARYGAGETIRQIRSNA